MNINTYLRRKYGVETPTTMTAREARTLGIPYPLRSGWLDEHGARQITISQANRLHQQFVDADGDFAARARVALLEVIEG
ncbi:hypothetical protein [Paraburkholderia tropica]|uniref:hypothetical protein n=1 Tax=Paraburkholderia tropica TaxID=92647 RepID=UPI003D288D49